ncbi:hypothetical protein L0F63_000723 [Massospora cicadina]|nr:hypothetical protein L0F63_000723 [Massospora cicadina]
MQGYPDTDDLNHLRVLEHPIQGEIIPDALSGPLYTLPPPPILKLARFKVSHFAPDLNHLTKDEKLALKKLYHAGKLIDQIYLRQVWAENENLLKKLETDTTEEGTLKLELFHLFKGPWDQVEGKQPFVEGVPKCPPTGNFYPEDITESEFSTWASSLPAEEERLARSFYTVIRRDPTTHKLFYRAYAEEYADLLTPAADLLSEASLLVQDISLSKFLVSRAKAFLDQSYLDSELDWLKISEKSNLEVTCGPYEVYTDDLLSQKSSFAIYVHARDFDASSKLDKFTSSIKFIEEHLPVPDRYRNRELKSTPIVVVNQLFSFGDVAVPMTAAYNLPNDEEAIAKGGSKLVIIKNVQEGKFYNILEPIANVVLDPQQLKQVRFEAFFTHILLHEVAHSNGPHFTCNPDFEAQPVRNVLQEYHSAMEETKADITGLFAAELLIQDKAISDISVEEFWVTYLASIFRSIRFGIHEAHGRGQAIQLNYLLDMEGFAYDFETGRFRVRFEKIAQAVRSLTKEILVLQGDGIKANVKQFIDRYATIRPFTAIALARLADVPIDLNPKYEAY